jgi:predicted unusual protein kinase regulating ubiquinone biosynthesis (AarF/ABC1/UbiB family)
MQFCEGCRVDNFAQIEGWNLSRNAIMDALSRTFADFMYCSTIFNGDPHAGNLLVRPGTSVDAIEGFTLTILDWGLAKRLPESKRLAVCQMVYAAATLDYGLLLDSSKFVGLRMKREDAGQSMEDMRFFLRDMAPRKNARDRIKKRIKADVVRSIFTNNVQLVGYYMRVSLFPCKRKSYHLYILCGWRANRKRPRRPKKRFPWSRRHTQVNSSFLSE